MASTYTVMSVHDVCLFPNETGKIKHFYKKVNLKLKMSIALPLFLKPSQVQNKYFARF